MLKAGLVAVFPLTFVRESLKARKTGRATDYRLCDHFGYIRGKRMAPATVFSSRDLSRVHCGSHPLVACIEMSYSNRWKTVSFCYYNTVGELVIPG